MIETAGGAPRDAVFRNLLGDLGVELLVDTGDIELLMQAPVVELINGLDIGHELRRLFKLCPLVVGGIDRDGDIDRLLGGSHLFSCACPVLADRHRLPRRRRGKLPPSIDGDHEMTARNGPRTSQSE
jgi:hypothetical protein